MEHQEEFDHIFREYYAQLFVFARRFIDDIDDCHDLVNDVYEDVWLHFQDIRQEAVRSYLYTNLRHKCVDFLRRKKTRKKYEIFRGFCIIPWIKMLNYPSISTKLS